MPLIWRYRLHRLIISFNTSPRLAMLGGSGSPCILNTPPSFGDSGSPYLLNTPPHVAIPAHHTYILDTHPHVARPIHQISETRSSHVARLNEHLTSRFTFLECCSFSRGRAALGGRWWTTIAERLRAMRCKQKDNGQFPIWL